MKKYLAMAVVAAVAGVACGAEQPWQQVVVPTVAEAAKGFASPPMAYRAIHWAIWGGQQTKERILADIEQLYKNGAGVYMINNSRGVRPKYFTPEYMELVKFVVEECKKRGMKVWIEGDAGYPDGFAGGMISRDHPELGMQGIVADGRYTVKGGETLNVVLPPDVLGIVAAAGGAAAPAAASAEGVTAIAMPADGKLKWTGPSGGTWDVVFEGSLGELRYSVVAGQTLTVPVPAGTTKIVSEPRARGGIGGGGRGAGGGGAAPAGTIVAVPGDGKLNWTAPAGGVWQVTLVRHVYRSSPTRFVNRADDTNDKDSLYSLIDYLDPEATKVYLQTIHAQYEKLVGDEFGKTVMGFRGDEPDYTGFMPWTPKLLETFEKEKGYDLRPYIAGFFAGGMTEEARRAKADYWDVWSKMFQDNFFKPQEEWCKARGMEYMLHVNHEEIMVNANGGEDLIKNEGSFWRTMRYAGVPGVDNLSQIALGIVADFPKLAGSAGHLYGRPLVWSEEGGGTGRGGKFVMDYQLVRGVNYLNLRGMNSAPAEGALVNGGEATAWYAGRAGYLTAVGRPAAQVALYHPTDSMWLGDQEADAVTMKLVTELMEKQIDFDHVDHDALMEVCTLEGGGLKNLSGQVYKAVVVPSSTVIEKGVLERLKAFAAGGGKVVFVGKTPTMVVDKTFLHAEMKAPDLGFAVLEGKPEITEKVVAALPKRDVVLDAACAPLKYLHKSLKDGEVYFFFNESGETQARTVTLAGTGEVQVWDAATGKVHPVAGAVKGAGSVTVPLRLDGMESRFVVVGAAAAGVGEPVLAGGKVVAALDGEWKVALGEKQVVSALKPWQEMGVEGFNGVAVYQKEFTAEAPAAGKRVYLDLGNVREVARVRVNGKTLGALAWTPYVWDVTGVVKGGVNEVQVEVQMPAAGGRGGGGGGGGGAAGAAGARGGRGVAATQPGGVGGVAGGGNGAGRGAAAGRGRGGAGGVAAAPAGSGLLGPVRLMVE